MKPLLSAIRIAFRAIARSKLRTSGSRNSSRTSRPQRRERVAQESLRAVGAFRNGPQRFTNLVGRVAEPGECLGNGTKVTSSFHVMGRSGTLLVVNPYLYEILLRSDGATPLALTCGALESARPPSAGTSCLEAFCRALPELVRNQVVLLDAV